MPHDGTSFSRREMLKFSAAAVAAASLPRAVRAQQIPTTMPTAATRSSGGPKNIIFMVSDGMSIGVPTMTEHFSRLVRGPKTFTHWHGLLTRPDVAHGLFDMASLNSLTTDSAAASSSWGSGSRIYNGMINTLPDGTKLTPLCPLARSVGKRTALVTTARITHATPAGFAANQAARDDEDEIAPQYLDVVDVLLGGGHKHFSSDTRKDKADLFAAYRDKGYTIFKQRSDIAPGQKQAKVLGVFADGHMPYTLDTNSDPELAARTPTLAEMASYALDCMADAPDGFLMQIEGARIDHAAHANDAGAILWDQLAFDDAIGVVLQFVREHPDTLVIITSDHGNSNPGLRGIGQSYRDTNAAFEKVALARQSYEVMLPQFYRAAEGRAGVPTDAVIEIVRKGTGVELTSEQAQAVALGVEGKGHGGLNQQTDNYYGALGELVGNTNGIGWTGTTHTCDWTLLSALGPGQDAFVGLHRNVEAFSILTRYMGMDFANPSMTLEDARQHAMAGPTRRTVDWA